MIKTKSIKKVLPAKAGGSSAKGSISLPISKSTMSKLPKYNFGSTMTGVGTSFGMNKDLKWKDYTGSQKAGTIGAAGMSVAGAGLSMAGGLVSAFDKDKTRFDKNDSTSSMLSGIGSGVASGASAGMMFGPWGAAIGGAVGGIAGAIGAGKANEAAYAAQGKADRIDSVTKAAESAATIGINNGMDNRKSKNLGIPGFNKGVYKFYSNKDNEPNARVASGEAVIDNYKNVDIVPGKYTGKDNTLASIEDGSTILPKDKMFQLPEGKSTPADVASRVSKIKAKANDSLGKRNVSGISRKTHELNLKNADEVLDSVSMYSESVRNVTGGNKQNSMLPGYVNGVSNYNEYNPILLNEVTAIAPMIKKPAQVKGSILPADTIKYPVGVGASKRSQTTTTDKFINTFKSEFDNELLKTGNDSISAYSNLVDKYGAVKTGSYSRKLPGFNKGGKFMNGIWVPDNAENRDDWADQTSGIQIEVSPQAAVGPKSRLVGKALSAGAYSLLGDKKQSKYMMSDARNAGLVKGLAYEDAESPYVLPKLQKSGSFIGTDFYNYSDIRNINANKPVTNPTTPAVSTTTSTDGSAFKFDGNGLLKTASLAGAVGSSLSQYYNATPETITPETYTANKYNYRSNLFNQLRDVQAKENIARYNNRVVGSNAGSASAMNSALNRNTNNAFAAAYDSDSRNRMQIGDMNMRELARINNLNIQEKIRAKGINMRNAAAARNIKYAAIQDIAKTILPRTASQYERP